MNPLNPHSKFKNFVFKIFAILIGLFFAWAILETSLQLESKFFRNQPSDIPGPQKRYDAQSMVILALGESTTAGIMNNYQNQEWPALLEKYLSKTYPQYTFKVINAGLAGVTTEQVVSNLYRLFPIHKPDLVISMMGVNDIALLIKGRYFFKTSKLFDILRSTIIRKYFNKTDCSYSGRPQAELQPLLEKELLQSSSPKNLAFYQKLSDIYLQKYSKQAYFIHYVIGTAEMNELEKSKNECGDSCSEVIKKLAEDTFARFRKARDLCPADGRQLYQFLHFATNNGYKKESVEAFADYLENGGSRAPHIINDVIRVAQRNEYLKSYLAKENFDLRQVHAFTFTKENFLNLKNYLAERSVPLIVMSYPTVSIDPFKNVFSFSSRTFAVFRDSFYFAFPEAPKVSEGTEDLYFVSNLNFNEVITESNYSDYFFDKFCRSWGCLFGHAREVANQKIAENIVSQQGELILSIIRKKQMQAPAK